MKIKKEVRELCLKMAKSSIGSEDWKNAKDILIKKYGFTPWNLLALVGPMPTIEYTVENRHLIRADD